MCGKKATFRLCFIKSENFSTFTPNLNTCFALNESRLRKHIYQIDVKREFIKLSEFKPSIKTI